MKAECPECKIGYTIDDAKIPDAGIHGRCPKCKTRFFIQKPAASATMTCPKCKHNQPKAAVCVYCGIIPDKYLKFKAANTEPEKDVASQMTETPEIKKPINRIQIYVIIWVVLFSIYYVFYSDNTKPVPSAFTPYSSPRKETKSGVSIAQFNSLFIGMPYSVTAQAIGNGTELSRSELAGYKTVMYSWKGYGSLGANMNATFQGKDTDTDGTLKLVNKAQFGLQ